MLLNLLSQDLGCTAQDTAAVGDGSVAPVVEIELVCLRDHLIQVRITDDWEYLHDLLGRRVDGLIVHAHCPSQMVDKKCARPVVGSRRILNAVALLTPCGPASEVFGPAVLNRGADLPFGGPLLHAMRETNLW